MYVYPNLKRQNEYEYAMSEHLQAAIVKVKAVKMVFTGKGKKEDAMTMREEAFDSSSSSISPFNLYFF